MNKKFWLSLLALVIILTALGFLRNSSFKVQEQDIIAILQSRQTDGSIRFYQLISNSISFISLGIPALFVITGLIRKKREFIRNGLLILLSIALAGSIGAVIKRTFKEPRPYEVDSRIKQWSVGGSNSFPSGHTAEVSAAALGFALILFKTPFSMIVSFLWAMVMMASRIALGVHNFTDIAGGFVVGCIGLLIMNEVFQRFDRKAISVAAKNSA